MVPALSAGRPERVVDRRPGVSRIEAGRDVETWIVSAADEALEHAKTPMTWTLRLRTGIDRTDVVGVQIGDEPVRPTKAGPPPRTLRIEWRWTDPGKTTRDPRSVRRRASAAFRLLLLVAAASSTPCRVGWRPWDWRADLIVHFQGPALVVTLLAALTLALGIVGPPRPWRSWPPSRSCHWSATRAGTRSLPSLARPNGSAS